jgi:hypothetical protein
MNKQDKESAMAISQIHLGAEKNIQCSPTVFVLIVTELILSLCREYAAKGYD